MNLNKKGKDFWGPPIWTTIHILALSKPSKRFINFLYVLTKIIPCDYCQKNLLKKLNNYKHQVNTLKKYFKRVL